MSCAIFRSTLVLLGIYDGGPFGKLTLGSTLCTKSQRDKEPLMKFLTPVLSVWCLLIFAPGASGQTQAPPRTPATPAKTERAEQPQKRSAPAMPVLPDIRNDPDVKAADIAIIANITAEELRFDVVPNATVEFPGKPRSETIWQADRFNLPDKVEPGVTYRNIGIRLKITSRLADIDRIVAEALGEIPTNPNPTGPANAANPVVKPGATESTQNPIAPAQPQTKKAPNE